MYTIKSSDNINVTVIQEIQKVTWANQKIQEYDTGPKAIKSVSPSHLVDFAIFNQLPVNCKFEFSSISISFWGLIHLLPLSALCRFTNSDSAGFALFLYLIFTYSTISIVAASFSSLILLASWASSWALVSCFGSSVLGYFFSFFLWFIKIGQKFIKNLLLLFTTVNSFQLGKAHQRISFISFNTRTKPESQIYWSARLI